MHQSRFYVDVWSSQEDRCTWWSIASPFAFFSALPIFFSLTGEKIYIFFFESSVRTNNWQSGKILIDEVDSCRRCDMLKYSEKSRSDVAIVAVSFSAPLSWPPPLPRITRRSIENAQNTKRTVTLFFEKKNTQLTRISPNDTNITNELLASGNSQLFSFWIAW